MSGRIRSHLRSNVVGYLALFFALSGTAAALDGHNTVFDDDIVAEAVKSGEVADDTLISADVRDDTVDTGGLAAVDLRPGSVAGSEIRTDAVDADELQDDAVSAGEIVDGGLLPADVNQFWAVVDANGTVARSSEPGVTVTHTAGTGTYTVDFNRTISDCAFNATIGLSAASGGTSSRGFTTVNSPASSPSDSVLVTTDDIGDPLDSAERGFHLQVSC